MSGYYEELRRLQDDFTAGSTIATVEEIEERIEEAWDKAYISREEYELLMSWIYD